MLVSRVEQNSGRIFFFADIARSIRVGIAEKPKPVLKLDAGDMTRHYEVNTLGPLFLFQAFYPLLQKSSKAEKKFIITSTLAGSIGAAIPFPITSYGASKAAVNFVAIHIHLEHAQQDNIVVVPIHPGESPGRLSIDPVFWYTDLTLHDVLAYPGMVDTDMASAAIDEFGGRENVAKMGIEILTPEQSATGCKAVADAATVESHGGKFFDYAGKSLPW